METCDDCGRAFDGSEGVTDGYLKKCSACSLGVSGCDWEPIDEYEHKDRRRRNKNRYYGGGF